MRGFKTHSPLCTYTYLLPTYRDMNFKVNINAIIPALTLLQGILFAALLILRGRREERRSDFWLAFLLVLLALSGVPFMLGWLGITYLWEELTFLPWDGLGFAYVPTMYLFLRSLVNSEWRFSWRRDGKHYGIYIFYFMYHLIIGGYGQIDKNFVNWWWHVFEGLPAIVVFFEILTYSQQVVYFILCYRLYKEYQAWMVNEFSDIERVSYRWFYNFLVVHFTVVVIEFINMLWLRLVSYTYTEMWASYIADLLLMYYISVSGYAQARVKDVHFMENDTNLLEKDVFFSKNAVYTEGTAEMILEENLAKKDANTLFHSEFHSEKIGDLATTETNIDAFNSEENTIKNTDTKAVRDADLDHWKRKVLTYFEKEKCYLNPELTLSELAAKLDTNTSVLSAVINSGFSKNFNDFVNEYRVNAFKRLAIAPQSKHLTLLAIAFDCGFNSKATFNRAFKKETGLSPKAFLDNEV